MHGVVRRLVVVILAVLVVAVLIFIAQSGGTGSKDHGRGSRPNETSAAALKTCTTPTRFGAQSVRFHALRMT